MPSYCCVPLCRNNQGGHLFPKKPYLAKQWLVAIKRDRWKPTASSIVCRAHFTNQDYKPPSLLGEKRNLKANAVPSVFSWTHPTQPTQRSQRYLQRKLQSEIISPVSSGELESFETDLNLAAEEEIDITTTTPEDTLNLGHDVQRCETTDSSTQTKEHCPFAVDRFIFDDDAIHYYTGLEKYSKFAYVLSTLGPAAYRLRYHHSTVHKLLSVPDQFFMTLIKLRLHTPDFELSRMFSISERSVSNIFITWINFMSLQWRELNIFPSRDLVNLYMPSDFKRQFSSTRVIVDGMECPVKKPKNPVAQQATFSTYKNRNTLKVLVGATPGGLVSYVSDAFGGSTSDRQITERGTLRSLCEPGDSLMADKGFNVQDLFAPLDVEINIPTFLKKRNRFAPRTLASDRKIASKRIHIERIIGLAKTYKILCQPMNVTETALGSEIIFICCMLCNFKSCIVSKNA